MGVQSGVASKLDLHVGHLVVVDRQFHDRVFALEISSDFAGLPENGSADPGEARW